MIKCKRREKNSLLLFVRIYNIGVKVGEIIYYIGI